MPIKYEWDCEMLSEPDGDILDHGHRDTYREVVQVASDVAPAPTRIVLVRDKFDLWGELLDRQWATVEDGKLPGYFSDSSGNEGAIVPKRFRREVETNG